MKLMLRIKWSALGYTIKVERHAWGVGVDENGTWSINKITEPKDSEFKTAKTHFNKWGITIATVSYPPLEPGASQ